MLESVLPSPYVRIFVSMVSALFITWQAIPVIIGVCNEQDFLERTIKRSSHEIPTPTFGGVAIFFGTIFSYLIWNFGDEDFYMHKVLGGLLILFFLGLKDDIVVLSPVKKLITQLVVATYVVVGADIRINSFFGIFGIHDLPYVISVIITIFIFVALINSMNLIDGVDGLAGGIGMVASGGYGLWFMLNDKWSLACLGLTLASSLLGFLRFNFSPTKKIFMGDTGSLIVGFMITVLTLQFIKFNVSNTDVNSVYKNAPIIAIFLLAVPIFDTLRVFSVRIFRGRSPFSPDRLHMHHLLIDVGFTHATTSFVFSMSTVMLTGAAYLNRKYFSNTQLSILLIGLFVVYMIIGYLLEVKRLRLHRERLKEEMKGDFDKLRKRKSPFKPKINPN